MPGKNAAVRLTDAQTEQLGQVMSHAFCDEPNFRYILPDDKVRLAALAWFFGFVVRLGLRFGEVYTTETVEGGAVWISPGTTIPFGGALWAGVLTMPLKFGWGGFERSLNLSNYLEQVRQQSGPRRH